MPPFYFCSAYSVADASPHRTPPHSHSNALVACPCSDYSDRGQSFSDLQCTLPLVSFAMYMHRSFLLWSVKIIAGRGAQFYFVLLPLAPVIRENLALVLLQELFVSARNTAPIMALIHNVMATLTLPALKCVLGKVTDPKPRNKYCQELILGALMHTCRQLNAVLAEPPDTALIDPVGLLADHLVIVNEHLDVLSLGLDVLGHGTGKHLCFGKGPP